MAEREFDEEIDVKDKIDPFPAIITRDTLDQMVGGHILKVSVSSKRSVENIKRQLTKTKIKWLSVEEHDDEWIIYLERIN